MEQITEDALTPLGFTKCEGHVRIAHPKGRHKTYDYVYQLNTEVTVYFTKDNEETQLYIQTDSITGAWYDIDLNYLKGILYYAYRPEWQRNLPDKELYKPNN
jgi:hypothetical protein